MPETVGVVSDTHWPTRVPYVQYEAIAAAFEGVSLILHAGDIEVPEVLDRLREIAPVESVYGNEDHFKQPLRRIVTVAGKRIALAHGQRPFIVEKRDRVAKWFGIKTDPWNGMFADLLRWFENDAADAIVFGHWHRTYSGIHHGVLLFNPGAVFVPTPDVLRWQMSRPQPLTRRIALPYWLKRAEALPPDRWPKPTVGLLTVEDDGTITTRHIELPPVVIPA